MNLLIKILEIINNNTHFQVELKQGDIFSLKSILRHQVIYNKGLYEGYLLCLSEDDREVFIDYQDIAEIRLEMPVC